jgi:hypothetical protein
VLTALTTIPAIDYLSKLAIFFFVSSKLSRLSFQPTAIAHPYPSSCQQIKNRSQENTTMLR